MLGATQLDPTGQLLSVPPGCHHLNLSGPAPPGGSLELGSQATRHANSNGFAGGWLGASRPFERSPWPPIGRPSAGHFRTTIYRGSAGFAIFLSDSESGGARWGFWMILGWRHWRTWFWTR